MLFLFKTPGFENTVINPKIIDKNEKINENIVKIEISTEDSNF